MGKPLAQAKTHPHSRPRPRAGRLLVIASSLGALAVGSSAVNAMGAAAPSLPAASLSAGAPFVTASASSLASLSPASTGREPPGNVVVRVRGNQLVDGSGRPIRLVGVDRSGTEYACIQGWGIFDGPTDAASVSEMLSWHINAVRVPLNEDCWLDINGVPSKYGGSAYQTAVASYVRTLEDAGLVVILDLHWNNGGTQPATGQQLMADADHAPTFWRSVATYFKSNRGVIFDLYNEPHDIPWSCWLNGGCQVSGWQAAGMQQLVNAVRSTGARQPLMIGGENWSGDLSQWLQYEPNDPLHQLVASVHIYNFSACNTSSCWSATIGPVAQAVPVVTGEMGENDCQQSFIDAYMDWADQNGVGYLGWTWDAGGGWTCTNGPSLISSYSGTPTPYGAGLRAHLAQLGSGPPPPPPPRPAGPHAVGIAVSRIDRHFWVAFSNGRVVPHQHAPLYGSMARQKLRRPIVAITSTPSGRGYWLVGGDGGVFAFGDARYFGSTGALRLSRPIVGMASTPDGRGYWLVAADGGVFAFGNARFRGSMGSHHLSAPIVGLAVDRATGGYWLAASDGGVFSFGCPFLGSAGGTRVGRSVVGIESATDGAGYRIASSNGGVFAFRQPFLGSAAGHTGGTPVVGIAAAPGSTGYWLVQSNGETRSFGVATPKPKPPTVARLTAAFQPSSQWSGGYVGTFTIANSGAAVSSWVLSFALPSGDSVTNEWDGLMSQSGSNYTITNEPWDGSIGTGGSVQVGIQVSDAGPYSPPTNCRIDSHPCASP